MDVPANADDVMEVDDPLDSINFWQAFPCFVNLLDIRSFTNLARTCWSLRKRCLNDNMIRLDVNEKALEVKRLGGSRVISFESFKVSERHIKEYLTTLRKLKINMSLKKISFQERVITAEVLGETRQYLKDIGVKKIDSLRSVGSFTDLSFIKEFGIKEVQILRKTSDDILLEFLQQNLTSFAYRGTIQGELLFQVNSSIPLMRFDDMHISVNEFIELLNRIHHGILEKLVIRDNIRWRAFKTIPAEHKGPIPDERPLLIKGNRNKWILHKNGAITICERWIDLDMRQLLEITICKPYQLPLVLLTEEIIQESLAEKRSIFVYKDQFTSYFDRFIEVDPTHKGDFPKERPLVCRNDVDMKFFVVNEDDSIDEYRWDSNFSKFCGHYDMKEEFPKYQFHHLQLHPPLKRFVLVKTIQTKTSDSGWFHIESINEFRSIFDHFDPLPHDFTGELPTRRPLVFKKTLSFGNWEDPVEEEYRIVLYEDGSLMQYKCREDMAEYGPCLIWNRPAIMFSLDSLKELWNIVNMAPFIQSISIGLETFRKLFQVIKNTDSEDSFEEYRLIYEETKIGGHEVTEERWLVRNDDAVKKCQWKDGLMTFSEVKDHRHFPAPVAEHFL